MASIITRIDEVVTALKEGRPVSDHAKYGTLASSIVSSAREFYKLKQNNALVPDNYTGIKRTIAERVTALVQTDSSDPIVKQYSVSIDKTRRGAFYRPVEDEATGGGFIILVGNTIFLFKYRSITVRWDDGKGGNTTDISKIAHTPTSGELAI